MKQKQAICDLAINEIDISKVSNPLVARVLRHLSEDVGEDFVFRSGHTDEYNDKHTNNYCGEHMHTDEVNRIHTDRGSRSHTDHSDTSHSDYYD